MKMCLKHMWEIELVLYVAVRMLVEDKVLIKDKGNRDKDKKD